MPVMPDTGKWLMRLMAAGVCAIGMAILAAGIALALGTTGHDWYAAWRLTLVEAMLAAGFDDYGLVEYRTAAGETVSVARYRFAWIMDEAWLARRLILSLAVDRAVLGACAGLVLFAMWLVVRMALRLRRLERGRGMAVEPAPPVRSGYAGRMERPDDWSDGELIAALARRSGRVGVLLVSPAEVERLAGRANNVLGHSDTPRHALPPARTQALLPSEDAARGNTTEGGAGKPPPADPGSGPDETRADRPAGDKPVRSKRAPGGDLF